MFGLLTHRSQQPAHRADFRKSYCGTCKTIGKMYGHKQRMLLNYDVVFLSELLAALSNRSADFDAISVNRCFSLPAHESLIPDFLTYTASINMLLASIKIQDNIADSGYKTILWKAAAFVQKNQFKKAKQCLEQFGLMMPLVESLVKEQAKRERQRRNFSNAGESYNYYSEMTGALTGEIFRQAAKTAGKPGFSGDLFEIGKAYGEIVYLADAVNDYEKDLKNGSFNPLLTGTGKPSATIPSGASEMAHQHIAANLLIIHHHLFKLPIAEEKKRSFSERLEVSIYRALQPTNICTPSMACKSTGISIYEKYQQAYNRAKLAFAPTNRTWVKLGGAAIAAGLFAFVLLALPSRVMASIPAPPPQSQCWQDFTDECCQCCCDAICDSICNANAR